MKLTTSTACAVSLAVAGALFSSSPISASAHPANTLVRHPVRVNLHTVLVHAGSHQWFTSSALAQLATHSLLPRPISSQPMVLPPTE